MLDDRSPTEGELVVEKTQGCHSLEPNEELV